MAGSKNNLDVFEKSLKDSLEHYEVPYNSADWAQMERALSSGVRGWGRGRALIVGLLVASGLLIGGTAYFLGRDTGSQLAEVGLSDAQISAEQMPRLAILHPRPNQDLRVVRVLLPLHPR